MKIFKCILYILVFTFLLGSAKANNLASGDNASLSGYVKSKESEETLIGASVYLPEIKKGGYTNKSGFFSITNIPPGEYTVKISSVGFKSREQKIKLKKSQQLRETFFLSEDSVVTDEIFVEAERDVEKREITISKINIPVKQIKEIRIAGESDVFRTIQMLPGVLTSSQISSGLYIRGGSPDQNLVLIDGSTVYNPSHLFGFISTFNSDAIKDVELIKGGYPSEYGSRLSSVINITQKDGNRNKIEGIASLGVISSKLSFDGPLWKGASWFIGGRRTYFDIIKEILPEDEEDPIPDFGFYDVNAKITQNIGKNDRLALSGFLSRDNFDFDGTGLTTSLYMGNKTASLRWTHIFGDNLFSTSNLSVSNYGNGMSQDLTGYYMEMKNAITDYTLKTNLEWFASDRLTFKSGLEVSSFVFEYGQNLTGTDEAPPSGTNSGSEMNLIYHDWTYSLYGHANYLITDLISFQGGLRVNYWDYSDIISWDPRLALRWQVQEKIAVKASWGIFHQYLRLAGLENFSLFDTWLPTDNTVEPSQANHYILSLETVPYEDITLNTDVYYKDLKNISEMNQKTLKMETVADVFFSGNGYAYGAEIFLQKKFGKVAGWLGYGLGFVYAKFDSINNGNEFRPKYDRRHDLKLVLQYEYSKRWNFGMTFMFQSGQSYTGATSRFQIIEDSQTRGNGKIIPSQRYGLRLPNSHQLNLSASYNTKLWNKPCRLILDIFNVYNRRDILMRYYDASMAETSVKDVKLLPIIPTFSVEIKI